MEGPKIPNVLLLNEDNEEISDCRIRPKIQYKQQGPEMVKKIIKKINNTIQLDEQFAEDNQINHIMYSNKLQMLITCTKDKVFFTERQKLEELFMTSDTSKKSLQQISQYIFFSGKAYLTPGQERILLVNNKQMGLLNLQSKKMDVNTQNSTQISLIYMIDYHGFVSWQFNSNAYLSSSLYNKTKLRVLNKCTCLSVIQQCIIACQKINFGQNNQDHKIIIFNTDANAILSEFTLSKYLYQPNNLFNQSSIISIFRIKKGKNINKLEEKRQTNSSLFKKQKQPKFSENDEYGIIFALNHNSKLEPQQLFLSFIKGNLLDKKRAKMIRGSQLLFTSPLNASIFKIQNDKTIPPQVQVLSTEQTTVIMIQGINKIYTIDASQPFETVKLNRDENFHSCQQIQLENSKFSQGMCLMKGMFNAERKPPLQDSNKTCDIICNQFQGQFMSLYFKQNHKQITIPFPPSLLILDNKKITRKYIVQTRKGIEQKQSNQTQKKLIKCLNQIGPSKQIILKDSEVKPQIKPIIEQNISHKKNSTNIFGGNNSGFTLFGSLTPPSNLVRNLFSKPIPANNPQQNLTQKPGFTPHQTSLSALEKKQTQEKHDSLITSKSALEKKQTQEKHDSLLLKQQNLFSQNLNNKKQQQSKTNINLSNPVQSQQGKLQNPRQSQVTRQQSKKLQFPTCPSGYRANLICLNPNCKVYQNRKGLINNLKSQLNPMNPSSFICQQKSCIICYQLKPSHILDVFYGKISPQSNFDFCNHSDCLVVDFDNIKKCIKKNQKVADPLRKEVSKMFDNLILQIYEQKIRCQSLLMYQGLSQDQTIFMQNISLHQYANIDALLCQSIIKNINTFRDQTPYLSKIPLLKLYWEEQKSKIQKIVSQVPKLLSKSINPKKLVVQSEKKFNSKVLTNLEQMVNLTTMLEKHSNKQIKSMNLLYRASQNQFSAQKFHSKCDQVQNTVVVLQSKQGQKIGGYTPLKWGLNYQDEKLFKSFKGKSFIFSLTKNQKFIEKPNCKASITSKPSQGPIFGSFPYDILIHDKANAVCAEFNIQTSYIFDGNEKEQARFGGVSQYEEFKVKQWQVFHVQWR